MPDDVLDDQGDDIFEALRFRGQYRRRAIELAVEYGLSREAAERAVDQVLAEAAGGKPAPDNAA